MSRNPKPVSLRDSRGQTLTEFALVLPILVLLLFGIVQFGVVFNHYLTITDATRAGARQGAVSRHLGDPTGAVVSRVRASAAELDQAELDVAVSSPWTQGGDVTVTASYPYEISLLGVVVQSGRVSSTTTERVE
jgi:Flp pilus assembly protein TadG